MGEIVYLPSFVAVVVVVITVVVIAVVLPIFKVASNVNVVSSFLLLFSCFSFYNYLFSIG